MDPRKFDDLVQRLSESLSRRSIVGGSVGASLLAAAGLGVGDAGDDALAKGNKGRNNGQHVSAEKKHHNNNNNHKKKKHKKKKKCRKTGQTCVATSKKKSKKCCNNLVCSGGFCVPLS